VFLFSLGGICKIFTEEAMRRLSDSPDKEWPTNPTTSDKVFSLFLSVFAFIHSSFL
jgi:hypothetical protein